jgi:hypothetical protein
VEGIPYPLQASFSLEGAFLTHELSPSLKTRLASIPALVGSRRASSVGLGRLKTRHALQANEYGYLQDKDRESQ